LISCLDVLMTSLKGDKLMRRLLELIIERGTRFNPDAFVFATR
jgi:hypothetical protein